MRTFALIRLTDASGISGTGKVGEGVVFTDGKVVFRWTAHEIWSTVLYDSFEDFLAISVTAHPTNRSRIIWGDGFLNEYGPTS